MKTKLFTICLLSLTILAGCSSSSCDDSKPTSQWHNCNGTEVKKGNNTYIGEWRHGERSGQGELEFIQGDKYVGEFKKGEPNGQGIATSLNGFKREGEFKDGKQHGHGTLEKANGNIYTGEFSYNFKHGQGTEVYGNGSKYTGEWKAGHRSGHGTLIYKSGNKYVGEFSDSMLHGPGIKTRYDEKDKDQWKVIIKGTWIENSLEGFVTMIFKSTDQYVLDPRLCTFFQNNKEVQGRQAYIGFEENCDQNTLKKYNAW